MRAHLALAFSALVSLAVPVGAQTTWYVDDSAVPPGNGTLASPYASLQFAIAQPSTADGDRIEVADGLYVEAIDFLGKAIHVVGVAGAGSTTIDGGGFLEFQSAVVFQSGEGRDSVLQGFTITNGLGTYDPHTNEDYGGGIYLVDSNPTIANCVVTSNFADAGAGIYGSGSSPRIVDTTVADNGDSLSSRGGGIALSGGAAELEHVFVHDNFTSGDGGGVWLRDGRASLRGCEISANFSTYGHGGGLFVRHAVATLERCALRANLAFDGGSGGGLALAGGACVTAIGCELDGNVADTDHDGGGAYITAGSTLTYLGGSIANNLAADGGGVYNEGDAFIADCRIEGNTAVSFQAGFGSGGGVWGAARLFRCLIVDNEAGAGPAFGSGVGGGTYLASLNHCTVVGNTASFESGGAHEAARVIDSIFWGNVPPALGLAGTVTYSDVEGGHPGTGNIDADPLFNNPAAGDYTLTAKSPCIDAGDPNGPLDPDGTRADMGAFPFDQSAVSSVAPGSPAPAAAWRSGPNR